MTDPLDVLRADIVPTRPSDEFAARLRARLESEVLNPRGVAMTEPVVVDTEAPSEGDIGYASLWVPDLERAERFYAAVLGWRIEHRRIHGQNVPLGMWGGVAGGTLFLCHAVDDVRAAIARVRDAGGQAGEPTQEPYGLVANCVDNQGMSLALIEAPRSARRPVPAPGPGGLVYLTVQVPDSRLYREFYGAVFGWTFTPGRVDDGWGVTGVSPMTGMHGGADRSAVVPMYAVEDIAAAVAAVRAGGGTSTEPEQMPYGTTAECQDDQGVKFYLGQV
ncbi:MAG TPA: hypothetical protein VHV74_05125 [Pseudonocardiaceae bacterium]|jgi:predicted enzyme related to lactoylglutathione lyase|nr:hypothetical protein [Pseudonocardiaceae bacterium]